MSKSNVIKQGAILAGASVIVRIIGFLYRIPLTHMIGDEGMAIYAVGFNIYTLFLIISSQGLPVAIAKLVSEEMGQRRFYSAHKIFVKTLQLSIVIGLLSSSILFFSATFIEGIINVPESRYPIRVLAPSVFIVCIMAVFRGYFQGMNNTIPTAISQIFEQVINAIVSVWFAYLLVNSNNDKISKNGLGAMGGTFGTLFGAIAGLIVLISIYFLLKDGIFYRINRSSKYRYRTKKIYISVTKTSIPILIGVGIFSITGIIDSMMIMDRLVTGVGFSKDESLALLGQYSGKYIVISSLPISISSSFVTAGIPTIANLNKNKNYNDLKKKVNSIIRISMLLCIPSTFGIAVLSDKILLLLYPSHSAGGLLLRYGSLSIIFIGLTQVLTGVLQGLGYAKIPVKNAFIACIIKIPLNYILVGNEYLNIYGAVLSTTIVYIITSFLNYRNIKHKYKVKFDFSGAIIKPTIASVIMSVSTYLSYSLVILLFNNNAIGVLVSLAISVFVYILSLVLIKGLKEEDLISLPKGYKLLNFLKSKNLI